MAEIAEKKKLPELEDPGIWAIRSRVRAYKLDLIALALVGRDAEDVEFLNKFLDSPNAIKQKETIIWTIRQDLDALIKYKNERIAAALDAKKVE